MYRSNEIFLIRWCGLLLENTLTSAPEKIQISEMNVLNSSLRSLIVNNTPKHFSIDHKFFCSRKATAHQGKVPKRMVNAVKGNSAS